MVSGKGAILIRSDLLSLDDEKLARLANRGLVKRARKILSSSPDYRLSVDSKQVVHFQFEDVEVRLPPNTALEDCPCSCIANKICRHRILAVMCYQQQFTQDSPAQEDWDPSQIPDDVFSEALLQRARRTLNQGLKVSLKYGPQTQAFFPTCHVTFLVPNELSHATCDCREEHPCQHIVLAVWAFRKAAGKSEIILGDKMEKLAYNWPRDLLHERLRFGVVHAADDLAQRIRNKREDLEKDKFLWPATIMSDWEESLRAYKDRAASYEREKACDQIVEWMLRWKLGRRDVLGYKRPGESELDYKKFLSLGLRLSHRGEETLAKIYLADLESQIVLVLQRSWKGKLTSQQLQNRKLAGKLSLRDLAELGLVTRSARRQANRSLILKSRGNHQKPAKTLDWDEQLKSPLLVDDFSQLRQELTRRDIPFLRARVLADNIFVVKVAYCEEPLYDPGKQELWCRIHDQNGEVMTISLVHNPAAPEAIFTSVRELRRAPRFISGIVRSEGEELLLSPLAFVKDEVVACDFGGESSQSVNSMQLSTAQDPCLSLLNQAYQHLAQLAHDGFSALSKRWFERSLELSQQLKKRGFTETAEALVRVGKARGAEESVDDWFRASLRIYLLRWKLNSPSELVTE